MHERKRPVPIFKGTRGFGKGPIPSCCLNKQNVRRRCERVRPKKSAPMGNMEEDAQGVWDREDNRGRQLRRPKQKEVPTWSGPPVSTGYLALNTDPPGTKRV